MSTIETHDVVGMTCDHCARAVSAEVNSITGVIDVAVDVATGTVRVTADRPVPADVLRAAIEEAGYALA